MVVNPSKTEFIIFHPQRMGTIENTPLLVDNCKIFPTKNLKILGLHFSCWLDWNFHIDKAIKKANSMIYAFRYLNSSISRSKFIALIHAHFLSKLTYACQVWSGSLTTNLKKRLESCYFKVIWLLCRDFRGKMSRDKLLSESGLKSLRSLFVMRDSKLLHKLCTTLRPEPLIECLLSQCHFQSRQENRLHFYDYGTKKIGRASYINSSKFIAELIPFEWLILSDASFHKKISSILPPNLKLWLSPFCFYLSKAFHKCFNVVLQNFSYMLITLCVNLAQENKLTYIHTYSIYDR